MNNIAKKSTWRWWDKLGYTVFYSPKESLHSQIKSPWDGPVHLTDQTLLPNLMVELGIYKTTSEAMRAGFKGEIPSGEYIYYKVPGSNYKKRFYCWMPNESPKFNLLSFLKLVKWYFLSIKL